MKVSEKQIRKALSEKGLKITPQRIIILKTLYGLNNHPAAENIISVVRKSYPNIAPGTIYKTLDTFIKNNLIKKVTTEEGIVRYDAATVHHHHLYHLDSDIVQDYFDEELDDLLREHFSKKNINGFQIDEMILQIHGKSSK
jgi:Fur family peroxide stress response transcriptional regulator